MVSSKLQVRFSPHWPEVSPSWVSSVRGRASPSSAGRMLPSSAGAMVPSSAGAMSPSSAGAMVTSEQGQAQHQRQKQGKSAYSEMSHSETSCDQKIQSYHVIIIFSIIITWNIPIASRFSRLWGNPSVTAAGGGDTSPFRGGHSWPRRADHWSAAQSLPRARGRFWKRRGRAMLVPAPAPSHRRSGLWPPVVLPPAGEAPAKRVMRENDGPQSAVEISEVGGVLPHLSAALTSSPAGGGTNPSVTAASGGDTSPFRGGKCVPRKARPPDHAAHLALSS